MWLSPASHVQATLDNGLPQYIYQDERIDVIYEPQTEADKLKEEEAKKKQDTKDNKDQQQKDTKKKKNGSAVVNGPHDDGNTPSSGVAADPGYGESSGSVLPQTGNKTMSLVSAISGLLLLAGSAVTTFSSKIKWLFK